MTAPTLPHSADKPAAAPLPNVDRTRAIFTGNLFAEDLHQRVASSASKPLDDIAAIGAPIVLWYTSFTLRTNAELRAGFYLVPKGASA